LNLARGLLQHAWEVSLALEEDLGPANIRLRRAISAAYYAIFHQINQDAVALIAPNVSAKNSHRIQRWFDHVMMKQICNRFRAPTLDQPLRDLIGDVASADMRVVARSFVELQEARHAADYDLGYAVSFDTTIHLLGLADNAMNAWARIKDSEEANVFILSLLLWKNWEEKERR
jgi:hypothetical protein